MTLLEKENLEKQKLVQAAAHYKKELEDEMKSISKSTERIVTNALFIGGALALTYFAVSQIAGSKGKKKKSAKKEIDNEENHSEIQEASSPGVLSHIGEIVVTQATMALLEFAKERLADYLANRKSDDENS